MPDQTGFESIHSFDLLIIDLFPTAIPQAFTGHKIAKRAVNI